MIIIVDNTENGSVSFFATDQKIKNAKFATQKNLVKLFDKWLGLNKKNVDSVKGVAVVEGATSFTSSRLVVTFANTLAFAKKIPVFFVDKNWTAKEVLALSKKSVKGKYILPKYTGQANIGVKK